MGVRRKAAAAAGTGEVDGSKEVVVTATPAAVGAATAVAVVVAEHFGCSLRAISSWAWQSSADAQWSTSQSCWHLRFSLLPPPRGLPWRIRSQFAMHNGQHRCVGRPFEKQVLCGQIEEGPQLMCLLRQAAVAANDVADLVTDLAIMEIPILPLYLLYNNLSTNAIDLLIFR